MYYQRQRKPQRARERTKQQRRGPSESDAYPQEYKVEQVELLLDRERPEHFVDRVERQRVEILQQHEMQAQRSQKTRRERDATDEVAQADVDRERDEVRRIQPAYSSAPECEKVWGLVMTIACPQRPLAMDAEPGNDEKQPHAVTAPCQDAVERALGKVTATDAGHIAGMEGHHTQRRNPAQRIDTPQPL